MGEEGSVTTIRATLGEPFQVRVWEDRTRGSRWTPLFDPGSFQLLNDEYDRTRNIRVSDIGIRCFEFMPMKSGNLQIVFEARYGWKFAAESRLIYAVEVL